MDEALRQELCELTAAARAVLEEEAARGGVGIPPWSGTQQPREALHASSAEPQTMAADASSAPILPRALPAERRVRLAQLAEEAKSCALCVLHEKRTKNVFARGNPEAELAFVGEGPGQEEDLQGLPFVGPAGKLLDRMIGAMGYGRDEVYICNVVKCRPPENRTPRAEEAIACSRYLVPQLQAVAPRVIVALGRCAAENLGLAGPVGPWRGQWGSWQGIPVLPTYHPAYLLRSPEQKRVVWEDLQRVMQRLGKTPPPRSGAS